MKLGLPISFVLHGAAIFGGLFVYKGGVKPLPETRIIPIEIVTVAETTNIRAAVKAPKPEKITPPEAEPMTLETPMENAPEEAPEVNEAPKDTAEPVEVVKEAELKIPTEDAIPLPDKEIETPPEEPKEPAFDLDKLASMIDLSRETAPEKNQQKVLQSESNNYVFAENALSGSGAGTAMTVNEMDALQSAMYKCWRMPADARNPEKLIVRLAVKLLPDGYVQDVKIVDKAAQRRGDPGNPFWDVAEQRALRAVAQCGPYDFLPAEKYSQWRDLTLNFRPNV